jgi:hypothetical protein
MDNIGIIERGRILQDKIERRWNLKKITKKDRYRAFLANPPRELPSIKKLKRIRNIFFGSSLLFLAIMSFQVLFFYDTTWNNVIGALIPMILGIPFLTLASFGAIVDYSIYKRSEGTEKTVIRW